VIVIIQDAEVLPALRELFSRHPGASRCGPEMLARMLHALRFLPARPEAWEVAAALEALEIGDEVAA